MRKAKKWPNIKGIQERRHLFYAHPQYHPDWPLEYPSRLAFGMNLADYYYVNKKMYQYIYKGKLYTILREKALAVAIKTNANPALPDSVPLEAWSVQELDPAQFPSNKVEYDIDPETNTAYIKGQRPVKKEPEQGSLL